MNYVIETQSKSFSFDSLTETETKIDSVSFSVNEVRNDTIFLEILYKNYFENLLGVSTDFLSSINQENHMVVKYQLCKKTLKYKVDYPDVDQVFRKIYRAKSKELGKEDFRGSGLAIRLNMKGAAADEKNIESLQIDIEDWLAPYKVMSSPESFHYYDDTMRVNIVKANYPVQKVFMMEKNKRKKANIKSYILSDPNKFGEVTKQALIYALEKQYPQNKEIYKEEILESEVKKDFEANCTYVFNKTLNILEEMDSEVYDLLQLSSEGKLTKNFSSKFETRGIVKISRVD